MNPSGSAATEQRPTPPMVVEDSDAMQTTRGLVDDLLKIARNRADCNRTQAFECLLHSMAHNEIVRVVVAMSSQIAAMEDALDALTSSVSQSLTECRNAFGSARHAPRSRAVSLVAAPPSSNRGLMGRRSAPPEGSMRSGSAGSDVGALPAAGSMMIFSPQGSPYQSDAPARYYTCDTAHVLDDAPTLPPPAEAPPHDTRSCDPPLRPAPPEAPSSTPVRPVSRRSQSRSPTVSTPTAKVKRTTAGRLDSVNQFEFFSEIGSGAQATVWLCVDANGAECAVKVIDRSHYPPSSDSGESGVPEVRAAMLLEHENIIRLQEVIDDESDKALYLVMEYFKDGPSGVMDKDGTCDSELRVAEVRELAIGVANALHYCHTDEHVVHGDIKPENVLVDRSKGAALRAVLADFGLAKLGYAAESIVAATVADNRQPAHVLNSPLAADSAPLAAGPRRPPVNFAFASAAAEGAPALGTPLFQPLPLGSAVVPPDRRVVALGDNSREASKASRETALESARRRSVTRLSLDSDERRNAFQRNRVAKTFGGTPAFLAPELLAGGEPTPASDMWALGVTLYALLFKKLPFYAESWSEQRAAVCDGVLTFPANVLTDDQMKTWEGVLNALLQKRPEERMRACDLSARLQAFEVSIVS